MSQGVEFDLQLFQSDGITTVDLFPGLKVLPDEQIDWGYDHSHYGPKVENTLAGLVLKELTRD